MSDRRRRGSAWIVVIAVFHFARCPSYERTPHHPRDPLSTDKDSSEPSFFHRDHATCNNGCRIIVDRRQTPRVFDLSWRHSMWWNLRYLVTRLSQWIQKGPVKRENTYVVSQNSFREILSIRWNIKLMIYWNVRSNLLNFFSNTYTRMHETKNYANMAPLKVTWCNLNNIKSNFNSKFNSYHVQIFCTIKTICSIF